MRCGLFGKLPAKRDFVAVSTPRAFLRLWEPWLEKGLAALRASEAGSDFTHAFATAPIWRFWLGPALCGQATAGAFMPSVDALGRMFPLTLIASGGDFAPPDADPREAWFAQVEDLLLDALDPHAPFEAIAARLAKCGAQELGAKVIDAQNICAQLIAADIRAQDRNASAEPFAAMRAELDCPAETATFWWTIGGADCPPWAMMQQAMPAPATFAAMLSRRGASSPKDFLMEPTASW